MDKKAVLDVGFLEGAKYPGTGMSVAAVAAIQEFGAPGANIPPRPFFRNMVRAESDSWGPLLGHHIKESGMDAVAGLKLLGNDIHGQLQQSIVDTNSPGLSPITLMLRKIKANSKDPDFTITGRTVGEAARRVAEGESYGGVSTKPLIDTKHMYFSVDHVVKT